MWAGERPEEKRWRCVTNPGLEIVRVSMSIYGDENLQKIRVQGFQNLIFLYEYNNQVIQKIFYYLEFFLYSSRENFYLETLFCLTCVYSIVQETGIWYRTVTVDIFYQNVRACYQLYLQGVQGLLPLYLPLPPPLFFQVFSTLPPHCPFLTLA